jgi:hypothetical protein
MIAVLSLPPDWPERKHSMRVTRYSLVLAIATDTLPGGELERHIVSAGH